MLMKLTPVVKNTNILQTLFCTKVFFVFFWQKKIDAKAARKLLMKLDIANYMCYTNILQMAFAPISFGQKFLNQNYKKRKAMHITLSNRKAAQ